MSLGRVRHYDTSLNALARLADSLLILGSLALLSYLYHVRWDSATMWLALLSVIFFNFFAEMQDVYRSWRGVRRYKEMGAVLSSWIVTVALIVFLDIFWLKWQLYQEFYILNWFAIAPLLVVSWHLIARLVLGYLRGKGHNTRRVGIVGATNLGRRLEKILVGDKCNGFRFAGYYDDRAKLETGRRLSNQSMQVAGGVDQLLEDCRTGKLDVVYITLSLAAEKRIKFIVDELADSTVSVYLVPDMFTFNLINSRWVDYQGVTAISIYETPFAGFASVIKRAEDIVFSLLILLLISIPMLVIAIGIKFTSPGPIFFLQQRYGRGGKSIAVWKFRSMTVMDNGDKVMQATKGDVRITPFGAFLRRTSLDELPQFLNVLGGSMSIVGPRPHAIAHNEEYRKLIMGYMLRHKIKPGITGLAQIKGFRGETDTLDKMEGRVRFDLHYIRNWSLWLDIKIIFMTVFKGFVHNNAY
ncbi:undecaprenyl-phosphate glucose phosphotransferase [Thiomicrorhabdus arctica]|uniref:undecaprenyl-phosphate glucose phosphotransferase n=1 Tax=Thiomicrorhabdus arctica TaxID=131540 RepID=UPI00035C6F8F|nr:undecaprenyl-phosphate glucose phosphotransferase [Thiomicrorhabdus arctica]